jgi:hypothetical protein
MKRVITFSLWGNNKNYTIGAIKNAEIAYYMYPDFEYWFYIHKETVPEEIINKLNSLPNTNIIFKTGDLNTCRPMMWRFEAIDEENVELMISRDTDTRILLREKLAVDDWLKSNKIFHIMRDHPDHNFEILGGMFGTRKIPQIPNWKEIMNTIIQHDKMCDQWFLKTYIYEYIKNDAIIHASFNKYEENCIPFPIPYCNEYKFVGEYVYCDNTRSLSHINLLKNRLLTNKIHLITSFYIVNKINESTEQRNNELLECLYKNLNNDFIEKIYLYVDDIKSLNKAIEIDKNNKIVIVNVGNQPTYYDMFKYSIDNLKNSICMISNSDIYLYKCDIKVLEQLHNKNNIFSLSRHENNFKCEVLGWGSHDAFLFKPCYLNYEILEGMNHVQNIAGSDDNIVNILCDNGFKLYNPCFEILIVHLHSSNHRTYDNKKIANGKYFIKQEYLFKDVDFIYYHGLDHFGDDIYVKQSQSVNQLKEICKYDINCVGFNTLGFFKNKIDISNLKETTWINKNTNHGIFIKKII